MTNNSEKQSIVFNYEELTKLWSLVAKEYFRSRGRISKEKEFTNPKLDWKGEGKAIFRDFHNLTQFSKSQISIGSTKNNKEKEITETYFYQHLIGQSVTSIRYDFLKRFVYYIEKNKSIDLFTFLENNGFSFDLTADEALPRGLEYLAGHWIGINRNLEENKFAVCYYEFKIEGSKMLAKREAYSSEVIYEGEALCQEDSSFMIHLKGRTKGRIKFIMTNPPKIQPDMLKCFSSAYSTISPNEPAIVKELVIKLTKAKQLSKGQVMSLNEIDDLLSEHFNEQYLQEVKKEFNGFLGNNEEHVFTLNELTQIKKIDLNEIRNRISNNDNIEKLLAYYRFNYIGHSKKYVRKIVKYKKDKNTGEHGASKFEINVSDEYVLTKVVNYSKNAVQTHATTYRTTTSNGAVDIVPIYPFSTEVFNNESDEPEPRSSDLLIDAHTDTFVSSATVINEFMQSGELQLDIERTTLKTEIVIDFGGIEGFEQMAISIKSISYNFNTPDKRGGKEIIFENKNSSQKTFRIEGLNNESLAFKLANPFSFDPENPKLFVVLAEFPMFEKDCFTISFNFNEN